MLSSLCDTKLYSYGCQYACIRSKEKNCPFPVIILTVVLDYFVVGAMKGLLLQSHTHLVTGCERIEDQNMASVSCTIVQGNGRGNRYYTLIPARRQGKVTSYHPLVVGCDKKWIYFNVVCPYGYL